jgi:ABC-2 type transport system ATP-binding protein
MDEPMSGLDPIGRREVRDLLLSLREQNKTIFFSSHILSDVEALCDRAAILSRGRLVRYGSVYELVGDGGSAVEVIAVGLETARLDDFTRELACVQSVTETPNGVSLLLDDENGVDDALRLIRKAGGKLVSVNPRRSSLEGVFFSADEKA